MGGAWLGRPGVSGNTVIVQDGGGLSAVDARSGDVLWTTPLWQFLSSDADNVAIVGDRAVAAIGDSVFAVRVTTGERLWTFLPDAQAGLCEIAADAQVVYVGTRSHRVYALSAATGQPLWVVELAGDWLFAGAVTGIALGPSELYAGAIETLDMNGAMRRGHVIALSRADGSEIWRYTSPGTRNDVNSAPVVAGDLIVVSDLAGPSVFALDRATGELQWRHSLSPVFVGPARGPLVRDGIAYFGDQGGTYAIRLSDGSTVWTRESAGTQGVFDFAFCGDVLLLQNLGVRAVRLSDGELLSSVLHDDGSNFPTSGYGVVGNRAVAVGNHLIYGLACP